MNIYFETGSWSVQIIWIRDIALKEALIGHGIKAKLILQILWIHVSKNIWLLSSNIRLHAVKHNRRPLIYEYLREHEIYEIKNAKKSRDTAPLKSAHVRQTITIGRHVMHAIMLGNSACQKLGRM